MTLHTQEEVDERSRDLIAQKLTRLIDTYDGSADAAREILRGLAAASTMNMDCKPFEEALARRHRTLDAA